MFTANTRTALTGIGFVAAAIAMPSAAEAQGAYPMSEAEVRALPSEYQSGPVTTDYTETVIGPDGVETVVRTRRIETTGAVPAPHAEYTSYHQGYAPSGAVFQRDQWLDECERRTSGRGDREKGGIIGGLLGAIAGGIIGNRVADGERLGGTLIGAGIGGLGGLVIGQLIGGGRNSRGEYDCEAALDGYMSQYGFPGAHGYHGGHGYRVATRSIPAYAPPAHYGYGYGYAPAYQSYGYHYAPPQQVVYVPMHYEQQQRVIVRETVREELVPVPGATRSIPEPRPVVDPAPRPAPRYVKEPRYIKGN